MDRENAAQLARDYGPSVYRLAYARTGNRQDAEDVMQETFLTLLRKGPAKFECDGHARAWLLRVAAQRAADHFRRVNRRGEEPLEEAETAAPPREDRGETLEAVLTLPADLRMAVHLYYYEGYSVAETARILGKSEGAVKTRLFRARAKLRDYLTEGGETNVP